MRCDSADLRFGQNCSSTTCLALLIDFLFEVIEPLSEGVIGIGKSFNAVLKIIDLVIQALINRFQICLISRLSGLLCIRN